MFKHYYKFFSVFFLLLFTLFGFVSCSKLFLTENEPSHPAEVDQHSEASSSSSSSQPSPKKLLRLNAFEPKRALVRLDAFKPKRALERKDAFKLRDDDFSPQKSTQESTWRKSKTQSLRESSRKLSQYDKNCKIIRSSTTSKIRQQTKKEKPKRIIHLIRPFDDLHIDQTGRNGQTKVCLRLGCDHQGKNCPKKRNC